MGPYCKFCDQRCFVPLPAGTPAAALAAYRPGVSIIATCRAGQQYEEQETGWSYARIQRAMREERA